jgi:biotin transporter BioY
LRFALVEKIDELKRRSVVGQIVVVLIGVQLLFFSSFIALSLPTATERNLGAFIHNQELAVTYMLPASLKERAIERFPVLLRPANDVRYSLYVPIIPTAVFLGYVLGDTLGLFAAVLYLAIGLALPLIGIYPFAAGGGLSYWGQPGFGYLLGVVVAAWMSGRATCKRRTSFRQLLALVSGLTAAHLMGLAYLMGSCVVSIFVDGTPRFPQWRPWVFEEARNLTWYPLPYDLLFSIVLIGLGFPFRWLVGTLTAPDMNPRPRHSQRIEDLDLV